MSDAKTIGTIEKSRTEELRVSLQGFKGRHYLDIGVYADPYADEGQGRVPTKKGIKLSPGRIAELIAVLRRAEAEAISQGLLKPESQAA
jgi:hypothetical protein